MRVPANEKPWRWAWLLVALYLVAAAASWRRTLIEDEIWALYLTTRPLAEQIQAIRGDLVHPPLWYLVQRAWLAVAGYSDGAAKALPLLVNVPAILFFTALARRVTKHGRLASFLFAATYLRLAGLPHLVRMYGLILLLAVVALLLWDRWRARPSPMRLAGWAAVMALLLYTHYFGALLLVAFIAANWLGGPRRGAFLCAAAGVFGLLAPWLLYVFPVYERRGLAANLAWVDTPLVSLLKLPALFLSWMPTGWDPFEYRRLPIPVWAALGLAAIAVHVALFVAARKQLRRMSTPRANGQEASRWLLVSALIVGIPVLLLFATSLVFTPVLDARFVAGALPAYGLLLGVLGEWGGTKGRGILYAVVVPWVLASVAVTLPRARVWPVRAGLEVVSAEFRAGDLLLADCQVGVQAWWEWRRLGASGRLEALRCPARQWWLPEVTARDPEALDLGRVQRVWLVYADGDQKARLEAVLLSQGFRAGVPPGALRFLAVYVSSEASASTSTTMGLRCSLPERMATSSAPTTVGSNLVPTNWRMRSRA